MAIRRRNSSSEKERYSYLELVENINLCSGGFKGVTRLVLQCYKSQFVRPLFLTL